MCAICGNTGIRRTKHGQTFCECEYGQDARDDAERCANREAEAQALGKPAAPEIAVAGWRRVRK